MKYFILFSWPLIIWFSSCKRSKNKSADYPNRESEIAERANNYYRQNDYSKAKLSFDTLISINPVNPNYYFRRGYSKSMLLGDDRGVIDDYFNAVKYGYKNGKAAYLNIGTIYRDHRLYDSAIFYYDKSLELDPQYYKALQEKDQVLKLTQKGK